MSLELLRDVLIIWLISSWCRPVSLYIRKIPKISVLIYKYFILWSSKFCFCSVYSLIQVVLNTSKPVRNRHWKFQCRSMIPYSICWTDFLFLKLIFHWREVFQVLSKGEHLSAVLPFYVSKAMESVLVLQPMWKADKQQALTFMWNHEERGNCYVFTSRIPHWDCSSLSLSEHSAFQGYETKRKFAFLQSSFWHIESTCLLSQKNCGPCYKPAADISVWKWQLQRLFVSGTRQPKQEVICLASNTKPKNIDILGKKFKCKFRRKCMLCHVYFALALTEERWVRNTACRKLLLTWAGAQRKPHAQTVCTPLQPTSRASSLKDTMPFLDVSQCSIWALEGVGGHCKYKKEPAGPNLPLSRHVLISEDTEASLLEIKRKSYLQPVSIRPSYLYATIASKVNPENSNKKNYIVFINGYSKIRPWHLKGWPEIFIILSRWLSLKLTHLLLVLLFHFCNPTRAFGLCGLQLYF